MLMAIALCTTSQIRRAAATQALDAIASDNAEDINSIKKELSKRLGLSRVLGNGEIIGMARESGQLQLARQLRKSPIRSQSGVAVVAVMIRPTSCPYNCAYCPTSELAAKSYTGFEPAALRARQNGFDAGRQVQARLGQFENNGHETSKCELIVMGGTFNAQPAEYQNEFMKSALDAFNGSESGSLQQALRENERAAHRVVAITFETRPDCAGQTQVCSLVDMGATRIELGVQSLDDGVLAKVMRGHGVAETAGATANCRDALLKVGYHFMPGLYSTPKKDAGMFEKMFSDGRFKPDMLKIYPALVVEGTKLHEWWKNGEFEPYDEEMAAEAISECKRSVPPYCRIMRVDRDIPTHKIEAGVKKTNLRELVFKRCAEKGIKCRCIRCREIGIKELKEKRKINLENAALKRIDYAAAGGSEVFLSFEDEENDALLGFVRLRKPGPNICRPEITPATAGVRELRVYGEQVAVGRDSVGAAQHRGLGSRLLLEAERIAADEWKMEKLAVISGVGAREYYYKRGYALEGMYVTKALGS